MENKIVITNWKAVQRHFENLDISKNPKLIAETRKILKKPLLKMRTSARSNLKQLMSTSPVSTGALYEGMSVGSKFTKRTGYFTVAFGARTRRVARDKPKRKGKFNSKKSTRAAINHFHLVNSGTKRRYHANFKSTGAVGKRKTTNHPLINKNFRLSGQHSGFADRAIVSNLGYIKNTTPNELAAMYSRIKTPGV